MNKEQQDKFWNDLSEEKQKSARGMYKQITRPLDLAKSNAQNETDIMLFALETTFGSHNLNPKPLTYEDICEELKNSKKGCFPEMLSYASYENILIHYYNDEGEWSNKQLKKILAINKLLNVAKYLNGDWKPDWKNNEEEKWSIRIVWDENNKPVIKVGFYFGTADGTIGHCNNTFVYFRTKELAQQAIQILGEETIRLALTTDY